MCGFCGNNSNNEHQRYCQYCPGAFSICGACEQTTQPCRDCGLVFCHDHMSSPKLCEACHDAWQRQRQQYQSGNRGQPRSLSSHSDEDSDPYGGGQEVQLYVPVVRDNNSEDEDEDEPELVFDPVDPEDEGSDWFRRRSDGRIFHIKIKGMFPVCQRIEAASKLYRLLLGDSYCVLASARVNSPRTEKPEDDGYCFVVKPKVPDWIGLCDLFCLQKVQEDQRCMVRFPTNETISKQLESLGEAVDSHGRFGWLQYKDVAHEARVARWYEGAVLVDLAGEPVALHGLHALSVVAWFLGESDMHSANFGVQPLGPGAFSVCVVDPSGGLAVDNLALPLLLSDYNNLPATAPENYETNGGWHLGGDDNFNFAPTLGDLPQQDGAAQRRAAVEKIKTTTIDAILAILDVIDDDTTRNAIAGHLRTRHARLAQLFQ